VSASWPPPVGTSVTVTTWCCGLRTAETEFNWDGQARQFTTNSCATNPYGYHQPSATATWSVT
jgi:hypothetical protein